MSLVDYDDHAAILLFEEDYHKKIHFYISEDDAGLDSDRPCPSAEPVIRTTEINEQDPIHEEIQEEKCFTTAEAPVIPEDIFDHSYGGVDGGRGVVHRMPSPAQERRLVPILQASGPVPRPRPPLLLAEPPSPTTNSQTQFQKTKTPGRRVSTGSREFKPPISPSSPGVQMFPPKAHSTPHDDLSRKRSLSPSVTPVIRLPSPNQPFRGSASVSETSSCTILDEFLLETQPKAATIPREQPKFTFGTKPKPKTHNTSSPMSKTYNFSVGLDHLDNLCRLIEQLAVLKEENYKFKKKCAYLQDTKELLKVQNDMLQQRVEEQTMELERSASDTTLQKNKSESALADVRRDFEALYDDDVFSKSGSATPKPLRRGIKPRSQSVGSVDLAEQIINKSVDSHGAILASVVAPPKNADKFKKSFKFTRWETVKRVFGKGKKDDTITTENFGSVIRSKVPTINLLDLRPRGHHGTDRPLRRSVSSIEPSSPSQSSSHSEAMAVHDDDLTTEIWMGPPEKRGDDAISTCTSEGNLELLVIELDASKRGKILGPNGKRLERRKSSPTLSVHKNSDGEDDGIKRPTTPVLGRSGSFRRHEYKSQSQERKDRQERKAEQDSKIKSRTAWGKVKEYIHTRKDSLKKRPRRKHADPENRKSMTDAIFRSRENMASDGENLSRSMEASMDSTDNFGSPESVKKAPLEPMLSPGMKASQTVDLNALLGGMSEEYTKKMLEWEEKKTVSTRRTLLSHRSNSGSIPDNLGTVASSSEPNLSEDFAHAEQWEGLKSSQTTIGFTSSFKSTSEATSSESTPRESTAVPPSSLDELTRTMSDSFNRKMQEWERIRYSGAGVGCGVGGGGGGPGGSSGSSVATSMELAGVTDKKSAWNWQKSEKKKGDKHDKEKQRLERLREKELLKVEREQLKIDKEKHRLERERQRTIKREVELERKKEQLEEFGFDLHHLHRDYPLHFFAEEGKYKYVNVGEYTVEGISEEFAKRLQEWEIRKGQGKEHQPCQNDAHHLQTEDLQAMTRADTVIQHTSRQPEGNIVLPPQFKEGQVPLPIVIKTHHGVPEQIGSIQPLPQTVRVDPTYQKATQTAHETQTTPRRTIDEGTNPESTVFTYPTVLELQESNVQLRQQLRQKESDYRNLQDDLEGLNRALRRMNESYTKEIASYKGQLWASSNWGQVSSQSKFIADAVTELRRRVDQLEDMYQNRDIPVTQPPGQPFREFSPDPSITGLNPGLVDYLTKLFAQIRDLREGILERNKLIEEVRKHLAMQEVTNLLLNADIQRRDIELQLFKKRQRHGTTRRHCTFAGRDFCMREGCHDQTSSPTLQGSPKIPNASALNEKLKNIQHGHFDPEVAMDADIPDILKNCGICFEPATTVTRTEGYLSPAESPRSQRSSTSSNAHPGSPKPPSGRKGIRIPVKGGDNKDISISIKCGNPRRKLARQHERSSMEGSLFGIGNGHISASQSKNLPSPDFNSSRMTNAEQKQRFLSSMTYQSVPGSSEHSQKRSNQIMSVGMGLRARSPERGYSEILKNESVKSGGKKSIHKEHVPHKYARSATSPLYPTDADDTAETRARCSSISSGSDISGDRSFKIRSASYFSPKPYGKASSETEGDSGPYRKLQRGKAEFEYPPSADRSSRQIGPLRKFQSATEILHDYRPSDRSNCERCEFPRSSYKENEGVSDDVEMVARSFRLDASQEGTGSGSQVRKIIEKLSSFDELDTQRDSRCKSPLLELANGDQNRGKVKRLSEVFMSESSHSSPERTFSSPDSRKTSPAALRKRSQDEIPRPGTVLRRLQELTPAGSGENWKLSHPVPMEGTDHKKRDEYKTLRAHSDSRSSSRTSSVTRENEAEDNKYYRRDRSKTCEHVDRNKLSPKLSKDAKPEHEMSEESFNAQPSASRGKPSSTSLTGKKEAPHSYPIRTVSTAPNAPTQSSIFLRAPKSEKAGENRLSPLNMLVRDTLTLNLMDTEHEAASPVKPKETEGTERRRERRGWFSKGFFRSSKS